MAEEQQEVQPKDPTSDLKEFYKLMFPAYSLDDLGNILNKEQEAIGEEALVKQMGEIGSFAENIERMINAHTAQSIFIRQALSRLKDTSKIGESYNYVARDENDTDFGLSDKFLQIEKPLSGVEVSGHQAKMLILASNKNIKKVTLYNSGFTILLRGPSLSEINLLYNRLNAELGEYGRMLGALFYMYADFKIKSVIWDFIDELLVMGSNLNKYDNGNRLRENVSLLDYPHILLSIGTLMFKNGYDFNHVCPHCRYQTSERIDLNLLQLTDFSKIPTEMLRNLSANNKVNPDEVKAYKKGLNIDTSFIIDNYKVYVTTPSIATYLSNGTAFNDEMLMSIHDIKDEKVVDQYLKFSYNKMFEPWISHIESLTPEGEISFKVTERAAIALILSEIQKGENDAEFNEKINGFIQDASITNIGYLATDCTSCGSTPSNAIKGFIPFDAQNSFFTMLVMRLIQTS